MNVQRPIAEKGAGRNSRKWKSAPKSIKVLPTGDYTSLASNDMSDMLNLNCWVLGDDPQRVFSVKIAKSETVDALKKAIMEDPSNEGDFDGIGAKYLDLWKVRC